MCVGCRTKVIAVYLDRVDDYTFSRCLLELSQSPLLLKPTMSQRHRPVNLIFNHFYDLPRGLRERLQISHNVGKRERIDLAALSLMRFHSVTGCKNKLQLISEFKVLGCVSNCEMCSYSVQTFCSLALCLGEFK